MMDRNVFLMLCQKNAVFGKKEMVQYDGCTYYPKELHLVFDAFGKMHNVAVLESKCADSELICKLEDVEACLDKTE